MSQVGASGSRLPPVILDVRGLPLAAVAAMHHDIRTMADQRLLDKVCLVTGSTQGIGQAIAELFAEHGGKVIVTGRNQARGELVVKTITDAGGTSHFIACDVLDNAQIEALVQGTVDTYGGLDVVVNNAAAVDLAHLPDSDVAGISLERWHEQMQVNLHSVYYINHLAVPYLKLRGGGAIVNVSSVGGHIAWPNSAPYLTTKGAINQMTRSMAVDYMKDNIRVNALCPGWIMTPTEAARVEKEPDLTLEQCERMGIERLGEPREMAYVALFLACDESSYVTGTLMLADGGWTLR